MEQANKQEFRPKDRNVKKIFSGLGIRSLVAVLGIPALLAAVYYGGWWLGAAVLALSLLGLREFYGLSRAKGLKPLTAWGLAGGALLWYCFLNPSSAATGAFTLWLLLLFSWMVVKGEVDGSLARAGATVFGVIYVAGLLGHLLLLRDLDDVFGFKLAALTMSLIWIGDTGAYFTGMAFGKRPLAPKISPKKSIEGLAGGALVTLAAAFLIARYWIWELSIWQALVIGLGVVIFGTLGDLFESLLKRDAGVKDSGNLLPGHGGVLDRFDSMMFALPFVYWFCRIFVLR
ncbi:MAG: phosphatidate cytidylyltransferase [bacterium]|nr:phosphatidate cytidylyltransferase [bacterium]